MSLKWASVPLFLLVSVTSVLCAKASFENTAIVRTVELGGSVVHVTTTYAVRSLESNAKVYTVALSKHDRDLTSHVEVRLKGQDKVLQFKEKSNKYVQRNAVPANTQTQHVTEITPYSTSRCPRPFRPTRRLILCSRTFRLTQPSLGQKLLSSEMTRL